MGYQINYYRNEWHTRDNGRCDNNPAYNINPENNGPALPGGIGSLLAGAISTLGGYVNTEDSTNEPQERVESPVLDETSDKEVEAPKTDAEIKQDIQKMLTERKITDLDDKILDKLVVKYNELKESYSEEMIALKLSNYARRHVNAERMKNWDETTNAIMNNFIKQGIENSDITKALRDTKGENDTIDLVEKEDNISIAKLSVLSNSYFEYNNQNDDGKIDLLEYFKSDLVKHYQAFTGLSFEEATQQVELKLNELGINNENDLRQFASRIDLTSENITEEQMVLAKSIMMFEKLDRTDDLGLDINEVKAYHAAMANFDSDDNMLDIADKYAFEEAVVSGANREINGQLVEAADYYLDGYYKALTQK